MDAGKRCFSTRCAGGADDKTIINQLMLRFRPIAPKPATGNSVSGGSPPDNTDMCLTKRKAKRKYVRVRKNKRCNREKNKNKEERKDDLSAAVVTLQPLPENTTNGKDSLAGGSWPNIDSTAPIWLAVTPAKRVVESWITVECVTETYMEGGAMGSTDAERIKNLEADTCPIFVSDYLNRVQWVNLAYKRMVGQQDDEGSPAEIVVQLVVKEELPIQLPAFACRVRVQSMWQEQQKYSQTMPCDVWRINSLGLAWSLDVKAALSLGR